jgi:hypothetical protein
MPRKSKALETCEMKLERSEKDRSELAEWLFCEREIPVVLRSESLGIGIELRGLTRTMGGVCRICILGSDTVLLPESLDNIVAAWLRDSCAELRTFAAVLKLERDKANAMCTGNRPVGEP